MIARLMRPGKANASRQEARAADQSSEKLDSVMNRYVTRLMNQRIRNASIETSRSCSQRMTSASDEDTMNAGIRNTENQMRAKLTLPRRPAFQGRSQIRR